MEELARSENTPATDAGFELLSRIATDPDTDSRYPDGTVLIPSDVPDASKLIARALSEERPIALIFRDGSDVVARPPELHGLALLVLVIAAWIADLVSKKRNRPTFVPREWVTEFHAAPDRDEQLVGSS